MSLRLASLLVLPALATGCLGDDYPSSLAEVTNLRIAVEGHGHDGVVSMLTVRITGEEPCIRAGRYFNAVMTGIADRTGTAGDDSEDFCDTPVLNLSLVQQAHVPDQVLRISDPSLLVSIELGDLLVPRAASLLAPADGVVRADTSVAATWSPASDLGRREFRSSLGAGSAALDAQPDGELGGYAPWPLDATATELRVSAALNGPLPCGDDATCEVRMGWSVPFDVTVAR
jgi:hypothetical protein